LFTKPQTGGAKAHTVSICNLSTGSCRINGHSELAARATTPTKLWVRVPGTDRGSRAERFRGRLPRLSSCGAADAGGLAETRAQSSGQGARAQEAATEPPRHQAESVYAQAITQQPRTMRRRPPRSLPRSPATEALSRSNTLLYPVDDEGQASRTAVGPAACDRFPSKRPAIDCCCPPGAPSIWCALTQLIAISMPWLRHSCVKEGCSARFRGEEGDFGGSEPTTPPAQAHASLPFPVSRTAPQSRVRWRLEQGQPPDHRP
jgi:hypothetical protein